MKQINIAAKKISIPFITFILLLTTFLVSFTKKKSYIENSTKDDYAMVAGVYKSDSEVAGTYWWLVLNKQGVAVLSSSRKMNFNNSKIGTYKYDSKIKSVKLIWKKGSESEWLKVQKEASVENGAVIYTKTIRLNSELKFIWNEDI